MGHIHVRGIDVRPIKMHMGNMEAGIVPGIDMGHIDMAGHVAEAEEGGNGREDQAKDKAAQV
jgi:hypothetical protein